MPKVLNLKKGFTLIELLIVMFIISVLVTLAVGGYTAYRKMALIDFSADGLVSQINEMRDKAVHGTDYVAAIGSGESSIKCFGLKFEKNTDEAGGYKVSSVTQRFQGKKVWNGARWEYQGCDSAEEDGFPLEMDSMVKIESISPSDDKFEIRFVPPQGKLEVSKTSSGSNFQLGSGNLVVKMRYGSGIDDQYTRTVTIDLVTGKTVKN
ncbi:MAG: prepilin-type N-terminal cleavage/methylation domain-containing protein [Candidatus Gracilibacteria bacterium]|jgi:prepilin-type N-terminal cleavage/methylation domain-containing protein